MKSLLSRCSAAIAALVVLAVPARLEAAPAAPRYVAIDLGTLGGPNSYFNLPGHPMNAGGDVAVQADTSTFSSGCGCYLDAVFVWSHGVKTELGQLPNGFYSGPFAINDNGLVAGLSFTTTNDPVLNSPEARAVLWRNGQAINLGTLPGGDESNAFMVNDQGLVAGPSNNAIPDPYGCDIFICWPTQTRGFVWRNGVMKDMGTLGGPDALPLFMNNQGQIAGVSYTSFIPNPTTGQPTMDMFLWQNGTIRDLGNLGGTLSFVGGLTHAINSRGEVVGQSDLPGDQTQHPVLWDGKRLLDLGTLGGDNGEAGGVNEAGQVVGTADLPGSQVRHAFLWTRGHMTDLVPAQGGLCSFGQDLNNRGQAVGISTNCHHAARAATLWEDGSAFDLNTLIGPSPLHLTEGIHINDRGEILADGVLPNGDQRAVLLVPAASAASLGLGTMPVTSPAFTTERGTTVTRSLSAPHAIRIPSRGRPVVGYHVRVLRR